MPLKLCTILQCDLKRETKEVKKFEKNSLFKLFHFFLVEKGKTDFPKPIPPPRKRCMSGEVIFQWGGDDFRARYTIPVKLLNSLFAHCSIYLT